MRRFVSIAAKTPGIEGNITLPIPLPHPKNGFTAILERRLVRAPAKLTAAGLVAVRSALFRVLGCDYASGMCTKARSLVHVLLSRDALLPMA